MLVSENEWGRHIAADAAGVLLQTDPIRALSGRSPHAACSHARPATGKKSEVASRWISIRMREWTSGAGLRMTISGS